MTNAETVRCRDEGETDPAEYAVRDGELLRARARAVRVARFRSPALSLGVDRRSTGSAARRAEALGLPVVSRGSGGLAVLHGPGDIAWSLVLPRDDPAVGRDFVHAYGRLGEGVVRALAGLGVRAAWEPAPHRSDSYCLLGPGGSVLAVGGRVLGGAAQHLSGGWLLHHGVLVYRQQPERLTDLFGLSAETISAWLTSLEEVAPGRSPDRIARQLLDGLRAAAVAARDAGIAGA